MRRMTTTTTAETPYSCPITGLPYVRKITFLDTSPSPVGSMPVQIATKVLFDGEPVQAMLAAPVTVSLSDRDAAVVTLYADAADVTPPFHTAGEPPAPGWTPHAPASIGGHVFCTPLDESWDAVDLDGDADRPRGQHYPVRADDDGPHWRHKGAQWVRCTVFVAEVEVR